MKNIIKNYYQSTLFGFYLFKPLAQIYQFFLHKKYLSNESFIKTTFKKNFGFNLNLNNPRTLNEKLNWLKLNYKNPITTIVADKYLVHNFIRKKIGDKYLIPISFTTKDPKKIIPENLPNFPFIIKTNHNSSGGIIVTNKNDNHDWAKIQNTLRWNLSQNYYWDGREYQYKNIAPRIIVEKLLLSTNGNIPYDYKFHCFNGKVKMIQVDINRGKPEYCRNWYDRNWQKQPFIWSHKYPDGTFIESCTNDVPMPNQLSKMIDLSEELANSFIFVRVDWYINEDQIYFGELTFCPGGGGSHFKPNKWDLELGRELQLSSQHLNLNV